MVLPQKLIDFIFSQQFIDLINKVEELLNINPNQEAKKDLKIVYFLTRWFENEISDENLEEAAKNKLNFLSDNQLKIFIDFIKKSLSEKKKILWQERPKPEEKLEISSKSEIFESKPIIKPINKDEVYKEKEAIYLETMKQILQKQTPFTPRETSEKEDKNLPTKTNIKKPLIINPKSESIPEDSLIIKKKENEDKNFLDFSKM